MGKSIQKVMTRGVEALGLSQPVIESLFRKAEELRAHSAFLTFEPKGSTVFVGNGDGKTLGTLPVALPEKIWIIFDDYGDRWVATALLPREY